MKNRKRGFSLVELLIVLAVIAALIATITPVALNAIRKSQATKVAQNIKTLASAIENAAYVNGYSDDGEIYSDASENTITIADLGRDIAGDKYGIHYFFDDSEDEFEVVVFSAEEVHVATAQDVVTGLSASFDKDSFFGATATTQKLGLTDTASGKLYYTFTFDIY